MRLEPLHVSAPYRNQGIGKHLTQLVANAARSRGATSLYISSIPAKNSVDAYLRMGATVLAQPDPELFANEPEDIHLVLPLQ
jgi:predicted N-acetyltransferase YhbS